MFLLCKYLPDVNKCIPDMNNCLPLNLRCSPKDVNHFLPDVSYCTPDMKQIIHYAMTNDILIIFLGVNEKCEKWKQNSSIFQAWEMENQENLGSHLSKNYQMTDAQNYIFSKSLKYFTIFFLFIFPGCLPIRNKSQIQIQSKSIKYLWKNQRFLLEDFGNVGEMNHPGSTVPCQKKNTSKKKTYQKDKEKKLVKYVSFHFAKLFFIFFYMNFG